MTTTLGGLQAAKMIHIYDTGPASRFLRRSTSAALASHSLLGVRIHDLAAGFAELIALLGEAGQDATATRFGALA